MLGARTPRAIRNLDGTDPGRVQSNPANTTSKRTPETSVPNRERSAMSYNIRILWKTPCEQPNGLQATPDGLWVLDQVDPNEVYLLRYEDGAILRQFTTRGHHGSGITVDPRGRVWIASTFGHEIICYDPETGRELATLAAPGIEPGPGAPHALEWRNDHLWCNVPKAGQIFELDPETGVIVHRISAHGDRAHGMAWESDGMWCLGLNPAVDDPKALVGRDE